MLPLGLETVQDYTFLELGDGQKILSKTKVINVPVDIDDLVFHLNLMTTLLLYDADLILGINWL